MLSPFKRSTTILEKLVKISYFCIFNPYIFRKSHQKPFLKLDYNIKALSRLQNTPCLKKRLTFDLLQSWHTQSDYDNFWQKCYWESKKCFVFPPHLSSASALLCEIGNPEDSALVHYACNTVHLLQCYWPPFFWAMPPTVPVAERIDYKT